MQRVYSLLVDNNPGVLSRIAGLFSRRGYSIDSITAGVTADPRFTRRHSSEQPLSGGFHLSELADSAECDR